MKSHLFGAAGNGNKAEKTRRETKDMDNRLKRFLSLAMAIIMVIGLMPANVVFATENEGDPSLENEPAPVATCAAGCMLTPGHEGACKIKCDKKSECTLEKGHSDVCMNGTTVLVDVSNVFSEKGLLAAIGTGGNIKLTEDIELNAAVAIKSAMTLDMNGKSITFASGKTAEYALVNEGILTITGNGSVAGIYNKAAAKLTIQNGTFAATGDDTYAVYNKGTATINGGSFGAPKGYAVWNNTAASMTIENGTVEGVYNYQGDLDIDGGTFNSASGKHAVWSVDGSLDIDGGTFQKTQSEPDVATVKVGEHGIATITGGSVSNADGLALELVGDAKVTIGDDTEIHDGIAVEDNAELAITNGSFEDANGYSSLPADYSAQTKITVAGGNFNGANAQEFAKRYAVAKKVLTFKNGSENVKMVKSGENAVSRVIAMIGSDAYPSLAAAVEAAINGDEIKVISTANLAATLKIPADLEITLNLNNQAVNADMAENAIEVKVGGKLTIEGKGSITNTSGDAIMNYGTLIVNDGTITGYYALFNGSHFADTATAILNGGTFNSAVADDYSVANCGRMTVAGATVNDWLSTSGAFAMTSGTVENMIACAAEVNPASGIVTTISGGKITYFESCDYVADQYGNVITIETGANGAVPEIGTVNASKQDGAVTRSIIKIKGGKIGTVGTYQFDDSYNEIAGSSVSGAISITGGTYTDKPAEEYIAPRYEIVGENSPYAVLLKKVDLKDPTGETLNNLVVNNGADAAIATRDRVLADIKSNENIKVVTNNTAYTLIVVPQKVIVEAGDPYKTSKITYSVTPVDANGVATSNAGSKITFNLPIPGFKPDYVKRANVYHNDVLLGDYEIKGTEGKWFVTVESATFSDFTVELIDINSETDSAKIGVKGYKTVQDAVNAAKDGDVIELLTITNATGVTYGNVTIAPNAGKQITIEGHGNNWAYNGDGATVTINGGVENAKLLTIRNVEFSTTKTSGEMIKVVGNGKSINALVENCVFTGPGSSSSMVGVRMSNTNGIQIKGGSASGLKAFLVNEGGKNLTIDGVEVSASAVGLELGAVQNVTVKNVTMTGTTGKYGISMDGSINNNAVFENCNITAYLPIMVYNTTGNGRIAFNGTNTMNGRVTGDHWLVLSDAKYSDKAEGTDPKTLSTTGRFIITLNDTGLNGEGINYKHKDGIKYYTVMPEGKLESAVVFDSSAKDDSHISIDIQSLVASERVVVEIYDTKGVKIAESKLVNGDVLYTTPLTGVVEIARNSNSWETTWVTPEKCPTYRNVPKTAKLIVDGKELGSIPVEMYVEEIPEDARIWTDVEGVGNMTLTEGSKVTWKHTLAEALADAPKAGGLVTLFKDNAAILSAAGEVTGGKTVTVTGEATFDWDQDWLFIGRGDAAGDGTLIFSKATIHGYGTGDDMGFHVSGKEKGEANKNNGTLVITNGSDVEVDFLVNRNAVKVDGGSKLTVKHGFYVHGRPASETLKGIDAVATLNITGASTVSVGKAVGAVLGEEGNGVVNVDDSTFICDATLTITDEAGSALNVTRTSCLKIKELAGKAVTMLDGAKLVNSDVGGEVAATGTEEAPINVYFSKTVNIDELNIAYANATFTEENTVGDVTIENSFATVAGVFNADLMKVSYSTVYTDTESKINTKKIEIGDGDQIKIDATKLAEETAVRVINQSAGTTASIEGRVSTTKGAYIVYGEGADDGDVAVSKVDRSVIYFNPKYERTETQQFGDKVSDGRYQGINAFDKFKVVANKLVLPKETTTIVLAADNGDTASYGPLLSAQNLVVKTEGDVSKYAVVDRVLNASGNLTIEEGAKIKVLGKNGNSGADNLGGVFTVNGEVLVANGNNFRLWRNGDTQIGKLVIGEKGDLVVESGNVINEGEITIHVGGLITAKNIAGTSNYTGTIAINADALNTIEAVKVIDLSGNAATKALVETMVSVKDDVAAKRVENDGDVYVYFEAFVDENGNGNLDATEKGYATIEKAVEKAAAGQTVYLLADATASNLDIDKKITLDLNDHTISGDSIMGITADGVAVRNGKLDAEDLGIAVDEKASLVLTDVTVESELIGIMSLGKLTLGEKTEVKATNISADAVGVILTNKSETTVTGGKVSGDTAIAVFGGKLDVIGGVIDGGNNLAIVTICYDDTMSDKTEVTISGGKVIGGIYVTEGLEEDMPEGYQASVTITGGEFTNNELYVAGKTNTIEVSGGVFDRWVPIELCKKDYICREKANTELFEVVYYEHTRIYLQGVEDSALFPVGGNAYVNGEAYEIQPGKVLLVDKTMAKNAEMFITTYTYNLGSSTGTEDNYPENMYVWYAVGKNPDNSGVYASYEVMRVEALDNFFLYNGTSIRVGGSSNGIRFFSSVDAGDANKLMNGKLITGADNVLGGATMTKAGTEFWKRADNKLRSEVYGGAAGKNFRVFQKYSGRNWFTGVLVGLDTDGKTIVDPIHSRPYAEIKVGQKTVTLYGGTLTRSIHYVATQNKDIFTSGSSYDKFVEKLIADGDAYLDSLTKSGTGSGSGTGNS